MTPVVKEAHELTIVSSSLDELEKQNLEKVNLGQHVLAEFFECEPQSFKSAFICLTLMELAGW